MSDAEQVRAEEFVWVFMSEHSDEGARGAPSAIFSSRSQAIHWINSSSLRGNLYKLPIGLSVVEYAEPLFGDNPFMKKEKADNLAVFLSGKHFLGLMDHEHFFD
jgi:hypothetical protein